MFEFIIIFTIDNLLIRAASEGKTVIIDNLLSRPNIDINCKNVSILKCIHSIKNLIFFDQISKIDNIFVI